MSPLPSLKKAIFLDRDGTLIEDKVYLNDPNQIVYLDGVFEALRMLRDLRYFFVVVTNQSGLALRIVDIKNLDETHRRIQGEMARQGITLEAYYYAQFLVSSGNNFRKPSPGMLMAGARDHGIDLSKSWIVGDRMSDVEAGYRAGTKTALILGQDNPNSERSPHITGNSLLEIAHKIVKLESVSI